MTARPRERIEVVAGVLLRPAAEFGAVGRQAFLLAQRPPGKAYAGYWEFPGGKVEAGESAPDALRRELAEELGIVCDGLQPWLTREFDYPHAHVRLKFFRMTRWQGSIAPIEHTGFAWVECGTVPGVAPILPANTPILNALGLPGTYAITAAETRGVEAETLRLESALAGGLRLIQVRDKSLPPAAREQWGHTVVQRARPYGARVLINGDAELAERIGADGVHLPAAALMQARERPAFPLVAASCHNAAELRQAQALDLDFAVLGAVLPTASHPGQPPLGWDGFASLVESAALPVYALGGMRPGFSDLAAAYGAHGIALLRGWGIPDQVAEDSSNGFVPTTGTR